MTMLQYLLNSLLFCQWCIDVSIECWFTHISLVKHCMTTVCVISYHLICMDILVLCQVTQSILLASYAGSDEQDPGGQDKWDVQRMYINTDTFHAC